MTYWKVDPALPLAEARQAYFAQAGFPADGGYADKWVALKIGPIPFGFPNTDARRKAVPLHDLHHLVTDYATDWPGEGEISAWEIGAGCGSYGIAWLINFQGMFAGWVVAWRRTFRAFVRGRRSKSLYAEGLSDAVLREPLASLRARLLVGEADLAPRASDYAAYALCCTAVVGVVSASLAPIVVPIWLAARWLF